MELIGYRFKNNKEECWAYTYDLDGARCGNGLSDYKYIDSIYADENLLDVEMNANEFDYFNGFLVTGTSFAKMYDSICRQQKLVKLGLKRTPEYLVGLTEKQLMLAWLQPEIIKVVE